MRIERVGDKQATILHTRVASVLFSYGTPVAAEIYGPAGGLYRTSCYHSVTTSGHINGWLRTRRVRAQERPQEFFDNLLTVRLTEDAGMPE